MFADYEAVVPILIKLLNCAMTWSKNDDSRETAEAENNITETYILNLLYLDQVAPMKLTESY